jgi:hypothetical protein
MEDGVDAEWRSSLQTQLKGIFAILGDQCHDLREVSYPSLCGQVIQRADLQDEYPALINIDQNVFTPLIPA